MHLLLVPFFVLAATLPAAASTIVEINFDNLPQGPSHFGGAAQTITYPQATFTGGVILGFAASGVVASPYATDPYVTNPNQYGTSSLGGTPSATVTIAISPTFTDTEVSFALLNGNFSPASYVVDAFNGATQVASESFYNVPANYNLGYVLPDLTAANITSVTISAINTSTYDFLIDDVSLNESVQQALNPAATPEPSGLILAGTGLLGLVGMVRRRLA